MSEDSLIADTANEVSEERTEAAAEQLSQEVQQESAALERPEWLQDRYLQGDRGIDEAIAEQAKGYNEIRKQLGGFTGAPEEYEFSLPEGIEGEIDENLPALQDFVDLAQKSNMSNETAQELFNIFVNYQQSIINEIGADAQQQKQTVRRECRSALISAIRLGHEQPLSRGYGGVSEYADYCLSGSINGKDHWQNPWYSNAQDRRDIGYASVHGG